MPAWRHFSSEDVGAIIAYLRTWQKGDSLDLKSLPRTGDYDVASVWVEKAQPELALELNASSAPGIRLGAGVGAPQLGWSTWLHTEPLDEDPADVIIDGALVGS